MIDLVDHPDGTLLPVRAQPGARRNELGGVHDGRLRIAVTVAPEKGKANKAIVQLLAKALGIAKSRVVLQSGETSRQKAFLIVGMTAKELHDVIRCC